MARWSMLWVLASLVACGTAGTDLDGGGDAGLRDGGTDLGDGGGADLGGSPSDLGTDGGEDPDERPVLQIPVVVHVLHRGEAMGTGYNLSDARVLGQIDSVNDDLRRRGAGLNDDPRSIDARIELVLAERDPSGAPTDGIDRVDITEVDNPVPPNQRFDYVAFYGYWDHTSYLNVWTEPLDASAIDLVLGSATGPALDFPGSHLLLAGEPEQAEGILITTFHFGDSPDSARHGSGRTLTHELGHYLGLLHPWGDGECATNDFLADTPAVTGPVSACTEPAPLGCDGEPRLVTNYMDYAPDDCMDLFTRDQVERMRLVLSESPERASLVE